MLIKRQFEEIEIYLTDDAKLAKQLQADAKAVIGICQDINAQDWWGISYLVEQEEAADEDYCREAYCRFHKLPLKIAVSAEICLRELRETDWMELLQLYDEQARRFLPFPDFLQEKEQLRAYIRYVYEIYGCGLWAVEHRRNRQLIGCVGFQPEGWRDEEVLFLGYLIRRDYRGRGIAKLACQMGIQFVEQRLGKQHLYCRISEDNICSQRLAKALGFEPLEQDIYIRYAGHILRKETET